MAILRVTIKRACPVLFLFLLMCLSLLYVNVPVGGRSPAKLQTDHDVIKYSSILSDSDNSNNIKSPLSMPSKSQSTFFTHPELKQHHILQEFQYKGKTPDLKIQDSNSKYHHLDDSTSSKSGSSLHEHFKNLYPNLSTAQQSEGSQEQEEEEKEEQVHITEADRISTESSSASTTFQNVNQVPLINKHPVLDLKPLNFTNSKETYEELQEIFIESPKPAWCPLVSQHYLRYESIRTNKQTKYFIALNLFNSEKIIPNLAIQLVNLAQFLGPKRIFVSIYENGSSDNTKLALDIMSAKLSKFGIGNSIVSIENSQPIDWSKVHRIEKLAELRNLAMAPLWKQYEEYGLKYDQVIFINDVFFCMTDVLELLHNQYLQESDIACGLDFVWMKSLNDHIFYDNWVSRDIQGGDRFWYNIFRWRYEMLANDPLGRTRWEMGVPFQVWSCWNGLVVLASEPFYQGVKFRRSYTEKKECSASECTLVAKDFWEKGFGRVMIVPSVKITYWYDAHAKVHRDFPPFSIKHPSFQASKGNTQNDISWVQPVWSRSQGASMIKWRPAPEAILCLPIDKVGIHHANETDPQWEAPPNRNAALTQQY